MTVSKMSQIDKAMGKVQNRTQLAISQKLAAGLPIATMDDGKMVVHQIVNETVPEFVSAGVKSRLLGARFGKISKAKLLSIVRITNPKSSPADSPNPSDTVKLASVND